ncbi:BatD family protein [Brumicola blandensis]|uniref:BatD family protein n=1 Tax=Brumicola blandensis TaxID=3075611 RepID=A0AAW8QYF1_9ALTE|nr:BatD family protein [Alteromonas sp. W409]MDT0580973.1 BatD family protein [Alteromonas sp. W409]
MKFNSAWTIRLVAFLTLLLPIATHAQITDLRVSLDKNPILVDEAVQLIVSAQGSPSSNELDLSILEKDFRLSNTSVSQSTRSVNFVTTKTTTWVTQLFPRSTGKFAIPAITVDGKTSKPIELIVMPIGSSQGSTPRDFFIRSDVDMDEVYLQQQVKYTTKLYMRKNIQRGSIQGPELENAIIKQIGEDKEYEDLVNGVQYRVIERTYAIIPQQSGAFTVSGTVFQGEALTDSRQSFGFISRTKPINRSSNAIQLTVLPIPQSYTEHWLPSEFVTLNEEWQGSTDQFVVGQPITRTITLTAAGLVEEQLPDITGIYPPDFKTYPDQANTATVDRNGILYAQRIHSEAIIPNRPGTFVLGEVVVPWFNIVTKQTEYAKLPARSIQVQAATTSSSSIEPIQAENKKPDNNTSTLSAQNDEFRIDWLHISLFILWLLSVIIFAIVLFTQGGLKLIESAKNRKRDKGFIQIESDNADEKATWALLQKAIAQGNQHQTNQTLRHWLSYISNEQVGSIAQTLTALEAQDCLVNFNQWVASSYSASADAPESEASATKLIENLAALRQKHLQNSKKKSESLALYPQSESNT